MQAEILPRSFFITVYHAIFGLKTEKASVRGNTSIFLEFSFCDFFQILANNNYYLPNDKQKFRYDTSRRSSGAKQHSADYFRSCQLI